MLKRDPTDLRIFAMRKQGSTLAEIAQAVELASSTVRNRLLQSGKFPRRLQNGFPQEKIRVIFSMYEKEASFSTDNEGFDLKTNHAVPAPFCLNRAV
jgi:hypothetical protein